MYLIYRIGPIAASMAVMAGAPMRSVFALYDFMIAAVALEAEKICAEWAFTNEPDIFDFDVFDKANWDRLADLAGESVDLEAWRAWARERGSSSTDAS